MKLSEAQVYQYRAEGYLAIDGVLTNEQLIEGRKVMDEFLDRSRAVTENDSVFDLEDDHSPDVPHVRRIKSPDQQHPFFADLLRSEPILDIIESLIGPNIRALGSKLNMKTGSGGSAVEWHQDFAFHPHTNDDLLALGVTFDDSRIDNGCLYVVPGSHTGPILNHHQDGVFIGAVDPGEAPVDLHRAVPIEMAAGSVSVHHVRTLHGSASNSSDRPRRMLLWDVAAADAWPLTAWVDDLDAYNAKIVRGEPTLEPRLSAIPMRVPLPLPEGTIFELQASARNPAFAASM